MAAARATWRRSDAKILGGRLPTVIHERTRTCRLKGSLPSEPAATQALAHILNASPDIARAFLGMLRQADIEFELGHIQAELGHEDICPDLTIHDDHGRVRAFVENKFWAGLTDAQPVSYLGDLPEDLPAALLFYEDAGTLYIPLRLKTNVERDRVVEDAVAQMSRIAHTLLEKFPDKG